MSWLFSQALVEEYSEASSLDGTPSVPSNTTPTPQAFLSRDKTTDAWNRFPSGMTCEPLTENRGEELLMWFRAGFLAPTSVPPARAPESPASSQDCGPKWRELSVKFDRASSSWKTAHCLLSEDLPWSSVTLPKWGMMRAGELWERTTLALPTGGTGVGLWPTPRAGKTTDEKAETWLVRHAAKKVATPPLTLAVKMWPTPCANEDAAGRPGSKMQKMLGNHPDVRGDLTGGTLSPDWTEWLMGWPIGHTASAPLATDKFQQWQLSHGVFLAAPQHTTQHND
jgi:hypothetical protein